MKKMLLIGILLSITTSNVLASTFTMDSEVFSIPTKRVDSIQVILTDVKGNVYKYDIPNGTPSFTVAAPIYPYSVMYHEELTTPNNTQKNWTTTCTDTTGGYNHEEYLFEPTWDYNVHFTQPNGDVTQNPECYTYHS
jgi:hypothetical protein